MSGRQKLLIIILVCSLAVNLLLVGGIAGRLMAGPPGPPMPDHLGWVARLLDEDRRRELRPMFVDWVRETRPLRRDIHQSQLVLRDAIAAEPFDRDDVEAALSRLRENQLVWQAATHEELVAILAALRPEERERVIAFLSRERRRDERRTPTPP